MLHKSEIPMAPARCVFAVELTMANGQHCPLHSHACTEIIWYRGCRGWLPQGGERLRYLPGEIAIYQPGVLHGDECEKSGKQVCVGVTGVEAETMPAGIRSPDESTRAALGVLRHQLSQRDDHRQERLDLLAGWLVFELRRELAALSRTGASEPYHVTAARRIFDTRFNEPLTVSGVAEELSINPDYLRQLFLRATGETPVHYLIRKRLECACDLLRLNQESTGQIAALAGIGNPYYFSRLFRSRYGLTPTEYRARYL
jgi:AraC-like DNA-binding protein/quercetin dioxygenase-like cupin family protein